MKATNKQVQNLVLYAFCAAILVVAKEVLAFLPNIELVSFSLILFALHFPLHGSISISVIFSFLQMLLYGVGMWTPMYFIVWSGLVIVVWLCRKYLCTEQRCAIFSGLFGLSFGFFFSIPFFLLSLQTGWISYLKGIPFDVVHMLGNYIIMLALYERMNGVVERMIKKVT